MSIYTIKFYSIDKGSSENNQGEDKDISWKNSSKEELSLQQGNEVEKSGFTYLLKDVYFHKEVYLPGYIELVVQIVKGTDNPNDLIVKGTDNPNDLIVKGTDNPNNQKDIINPIKNFSLIDLISTDSDGQTELAVSYWVFNTSFRKTEVDSKITYYATLKAYSLDKFLTLDKFNRAFSRRKLIGNVFGDDNEDSGDESEKRKGIVDVAIEKSGNAKSFQIYKQFVKDDSGKKYADNLNHLKVKGVETVLPYNVQYNESFYNFLVRICNRNGEFLYSRGNQLQIGLHEVGENITNLAGFSSVEYNESFWDYCSETTFLKDNSSENTQTMVTTDTIYPPEYFSEIKKDDYTKMEDYISWPSTLFIGLKATADCQTLGESVAKAGEIVAVDAGVSIIQKELTNKSYKDEYFGGVSEDKEKYTPFVNENKVDVDFYEGILNGEEKSEQGQLIVRFDTCQDYDLGDRITFNNKTYVVYRIKGSCVYNNSSDNKTIEQSPIYKQSYELLLVPQDKDDGKFYPLPLRDLHIRKSSPQRAKVQSNFDPDKLGRVRIKYYWQDDDDDDSPWIRVSAPGASKESGLMFFQQEGDEVLIDYEEGNIDRPFVAGALYSQTNPVPVSSEAHFHGSVNSLSSPHGHHLSFIDSPGDQFMWDVLPVVKTLSGLGVMDLISKTEKMDKLGGGFEIADAYGFYSIKGSTNGRNVSVSSPLGDITLDAFTGITINAPLGDVEIVGKNVKIEARNNLELVSGTNIDNPYLYEDGAGWKDILKYQGKAMGMAFGEFVIDFLGIDLSLLRTLFEVIFRPIGGTMLIKSYRFLRMEAGEGKTTIYKSRPQGSGIKSFFLRKSADSVTDDLGSVLKTVQSTYKSYNDLRTLLVDDSNSHLINSVVNYRKENSYLPLQTSTLQKQFEKTQDEIKLVDKMFSQTGVTDDEITNWQKVVCNPLLNKVNKAQSEYNQAKIDGKVKSEIEILEKDMKTAKELHAEFENNILKAVSALKNMRNEIKELIKKANELKSIAVYLQDTHKSAVNDAVSKIKKVFVDYLESGDANAQLQLQTVTMPNVSTEDYRKIIFDSAQTYLNNPQTYINNATALAKYKDVQMDKDKLDNKWDSFTEDEVKQAITIKKNTRKRDGALEWLKHGWKYEDNVWGTEDKGDILFSSKPKQSYYIDKDGQIKVVSNTIVDYIVNSLLDVKDLK